MIYANCQATKKSCHKYIQQPFYHHWFCNYGRSRLGDYKNLFTTSKTSGKSIPIFVKCSRVGIPALVQPLRL